MRWPPVPWFMAFSLFVGLFSSWDAPLPLCCCCISKTLICFAGVSGASAGRCSDCLIEGQVSPWSVLCLCCPSLSVCFSVSDLVQASRAALTSDLLFLCVREMPQKSYHCGIQMLSPRLSLLLRSGSKISCQHAFLKTVVLVAIPGVWRCSGIFVKGMGFGPSC